MANNRMYLLHRPSGKAVYIAKRMGWGWYNVSDDIAEQIRQLFALVESQEAKGSQDDFCIAMEDADKATMALELVGDVKFDEISRDA